MVFEPPAWKRTVDPESVYIMQLSYANDSINIIALKLAHDLSFHTVDLLVFGLHRITSEYLLIVIL